MKKAILVVLVLALLTLLLSGCASPEERAWNSGQKALAKEKFADAVAAFEKAGSYEDAETLLLYARAAQALENGEYANAGEAFEALGDFKDSQLMGSYSRAREQEALAQASFAGGDAEQAVDAMQEAIAGYSGLAMFRDSDTRATECRELLYNKANEWLSITRYDAAAAGFAALGDWQDSARQQKYCEAAMLEEQGSYVEAAARFDEIAGLLDATTRAEDARAQAYQLASELQENGDYEAAARAFGELGSYRDAKEQRVNASVQLIRKSLHAGAYTQALEKLNRLPDTSVFPTQTADENRSIELFLDAFINTWMNAHAHVMNAFFSCNLMQPYLDPGGELDNQIRAEIVDDDTALNYGYVYLGSEVQEILRLDDGFYATRVRGTSTHGGVEGQVETAETLQVLLDTTRGNPIAMAVLPA